MHAPAGLTVISLPADQRVQLELRQHLKAFEIAVSAVLWFAGLAVLVWAWSLRLQGPEPFSGWLLAGSLALLLAAAVRGVFMLRSARLRLLEDHIEVTFGMLKQAPIRGVPYSEMVHVEAHGSRVVYWDSRGEQHRLIGLADAKQADFTAEQIRARLTLSRAPQAQSPPGPKKTPAGYAAWRLGEVLLIALAVGPFVFFARSCGETLARLPLTETPSSISVELEGGTTVFFGTEIAFESTEVSLRRLPIDEYPRLVIYRILVEQGDELIAQQRCDPRNTVISMSSGSTTKRYWFEGLLRGCTFEVPRSGRYTIEAWLEAVGTAAGWSVDEPTLVLKLQ